jgi:multidrug resistance efflux pump
MSTSCSKRLAAIDAPSSRFHWELQMKNNAVLPLLLAGVTGGVFLTVLQVTPTVPASDEIKPGLARLAPSAAPKAAASVIPQKPPASELAPATSDKPGLLTTQGRVVAQKELEVKSKTCGFLRTVSVELGESVKQGQLLAELDPTDVLKQVKRAEATLAASKSRLEQARENLAIAQMSLTAQGTRAGASIKSATARAARARSRADRVKEALKNCAISQEESDEAEALAVEAAANLELSKVQLDDLKTLEMTLDLRRQDVACAETQVTLDGIALQEAQQRLEETKITAPFSGVITARNAQPGQCISAGTSSADTTLFKISDLSRVFIETRVPIGRTGEVKTGQATTIHADVCPNTTFQGQVAFIAPCGAGAGKDVTVCVKIEVLGGDHPLLKPETLANVEFEK